MSSSKKQYRHSHYHRPQLPSVACFFMVAHSSIPKAISVRYSHWGKRCSYFVIVANGLQQQDDDADQEQHLDDNTILVDIHYLIKLELEARGEGMETVLPGGNNNNNNSPATTTKATNNNPPHPDNDAEDHSYSYTNFPSHQNETKQNLGLKSFYSWMYMARQFSHKIDYIMKVDPDTYMIMDHYLHYLSNNHSPERHAYVGRVFKTNGNHRMPFLTGLSCTLSRATARLLLRKSSLHGTTAASGKHSNNPPLSSSSSQQPTNKECSANQFQTGGDADDHILSTCLSSLGIYPSYTRDKLGRELFLHFNPTQHGLAPSEHGGGVRSSSQKQQHQQQQCPTKDDWIDEFSFTPRYPRKECCSRYACAFHYVESDRMNDTLVYDTMFGIWYWKGNKTK